MERAIRYQQTLKIERNLWSLLSKDYRCGIRLSEHVIVFQGTALRLGGDVLVRIAGGVGYCLRAVTKGIINKPSPGRGVYGIWV